MNCLPSRFTQIFIIGVVLTTRNLPASELTDLFVRGSEGYHTYRIPSLVSSTRGTLLAFCEGRKTSSIDDGDNDLLVRRSVDYGHTWYPQKLVYEEGNDKLITIGNPCAVVDRITGTIWLVFNRNNDDVLVTHSRDDGETWSPPENITHQVKKPSWGWYATGPGIGIQLTHGSNKGRLMIPCDHRKTGNRTGPSSSHVIYSDDHGKTWTLGGETEPHSNECQIVERSDGTLLLNARNHWARSGQRPDLAYQRILAISADGGLHWSSAGFDSTLIEPACQASLIRYPAQSRQGHYWMLFANPASRKTRERLTVRLSRDDGRTWPVSHCFYEGSAAYSCLSVLDNGRVGLLFERDQSSKISYLSFDLDTLCR